MMVMSDGHAIGAAVAHVKIHIQKESEGGKKKKDAQERATNRYGAGPHENENERLAKEKSNMQCINYC